MRNTLFSFLVIGYFLTRAASPAISADGKKSGAQAIKPQAVNLGRPVDFERDIFPFLDTNCVACHNVAIDESRFVLEDVKSILKGGKRGPAVVPGQPDKSLLYLVASRNKKPAMPPLPNKVEAAALTPKQVGLLRQWIIEGATAGAGSSQAAIQWQPIPSGLTAIYSVALSPWGRLIASGRTNQISIFDVGTNQEVAELRDPALSAIKFGDKLMYPSGAAHRDFVHSLAFSPDGTMLASGGYRVVKLWKHDQNIRSLQATAAAAVTAVAVNADGSKIAVGSADNSIQIISTKTGKLERKLAGHTGSVTGLQFWPTPEDQAVVDKALATANAGVITAVDRASAAKKAVEEFDPKALKLDAEKAKTRKGQLVVAQQATAKAIDAAKAVVKTATDARTAFAAKVAAESKLFSASLDKSLRVWNVADGANIRTVQTPAPVNDLTVTKDALKIVSANADNIIRVWNTVKPEAKPVAEGQKPEVGEKPVLEIKGHSKAVTSLDLVLPGGTQIISGSEDGTVRHWDLNNGRAIRAMNHGGPVTDVASRPDGKFVASASANNIAKLWQLNNGQQKAELKGNLTLNRKVKFLTDEQSVAKQKVALAAAAQKVAEKDVTDREAAVKKATAAKTAADKALVEAKKKEKTATDKVTAEKAALAKKPDDAGLKNKVTAAEKVQTTEAAAVKKATSTQAASVRSLQLSQKAVTNSKAQLEKSKAAKTAADGYQKNVDAQLVAAQKVDTAAQKPIRTIDFSPDGKRIATAGDDNIVHIWNGTTGAAMDLLTGHTASVAAIAFGNGNALVTGSADKTAAVWNTNPGWKLVGQLGPKKEAPLDVTTSPFVSRVLSLDFSPNGKLLATGGGDPSRSGELMIWDVEKRSLVRNIEDAHSDTVLGLEFSRDGKFIVSGAADKFVKIFEVATGKHVKSFEGHTHHVLDVTWKADGVTIASAGADNAIKVWNVETGEQRTTITNYTKQVTSIQFIGVGDNIVSCGGDKTVRFHRSTNRQNYRNFAGGTDFMYSAAASRDETVVVAGGEDGVLRVWNGTNGQSLATFNPPRTAQ